MKIRSRFEALKIRAALIIFGVSVGLLARWIFGVDSDQKEPVFKPIPSEFRDKHSESDLFEFLNEDGFFGDPFEN